MSGPDSRRPGGPLRLGVAGLGTVGAGLLDRLARSEARLRGRVEVVGVTARDRHRPRPIDVSGLAWAEDPVALAARPDVDVFVELIGGADGVARAAVEAALERGASVVTANKALIAHHGEALVRLAERTGAAIAFEAAVAGGVPIVRALRDGLAGAEVMRLEGVLNGTSNYLLSAMEGRGWSFAEALAQAQALGFAEADPFMDVSGTDAAHKIAILAGIGFHAAPDLAAVDIAGIERLTPLDIASARRLGYRIKPLAMAERRGDGLRARVGPALVPLDHPLAKLDGALNAVVVEAHPTGPLTFAGAGAGAGPTAAAVLSDLVDLVEGVRRPPFGVSADRLIRLGLDRSDPRGRHYMRVLVVDRPGTLAAVSKALGDAGVSIDSFHQDADGDARGEVPLFLTTQPCTKAALDAAATAIASLDVVADDPLTLPIEHGGGRSRE